MSQLHPAYLVGLAGLLAAVGVAAEPQAVLVLDASAPIVRNTPVIVPVALTYEDATINALAFSIDIDTRRLAFDPTDGDMDGVPDAVTLPAGMPSVVYIAYEPTDTGGEIDVMLANLSGAAIPQDVILEFELTSLRHGSLFGRIDFADQPPASFGDAQGQSVEGETFVVLESEALFADGFESGDTTAWVRSSLSGG